MPTKQKYIGNIIQYPEISKWNIGDTILINAPTGSGKSFWVQTYLISFCRENNKKILFLTNRNLLKEQIKKITKENKDIITIINYQAIENLLLKRKKIKEYDYIVADECHYFFNDAQFNRKTDLTIDWLLSQKNSIKILLSATGKLVEMYLQYRKINPIKYEIETDYSFIKNFYFYNNNDAMKKMLSQLPENEKAIYFASAEKTYKLSQEFKNCAFICSETNRENQYRKFSNNEVKEQIIKNEKFDCQILCTTTVLDNGVNIKDESVKYIIIDYFDLDTIQQCIGRRRILSENDKVNVYIRNRKKNSLNMTMLKNIKKLEQAEYLKTHGEQEFVKKYQKKDYGRMIDDVIDENGNIHKKFNKIMYAKYKYDNFQIVDMMKKENGYIEAVLKRFRIREWKLLDKEFDKITLEEKLEQYVGVKMFKEKQKEFKDFINKNIIKVIAGSKDSLGYQTINSRFEELDLPYRIESKKERSRKSDNYNKWYWIIKKLI